MSFNAGCEKQRVGAVLFAGSAVDQRLAGAGFNHTFTGYQCRECPRNLDRSIKSATLVELCHAIHAEEDACHDAHHKGYVNKGESLTMYVTATDPAGAIKFLDEPVFTCTGCAKTMLAFGVTHVSVLTRNGPVQLTIQEALKTAFEYVRCQHGV